MSDVRVKVALGAEQNHHLTVLSQLYIFPSFSVFKLTDGATGLSKFRLENMKTLKQQTMKVSEISSFFSG